MADYTTLASVKTSLYIEGTALNGTQDDAFLSTLITRASQYVDTHTNRVFVGTVQTRYFDPTIDSDGRTLILDFDLLSPITITNGDGSTVASSDYILLPPNYTPHYAIKLKSSSSATWSFTDTQENSISVNGTWGYSATVPSDVEQATIRLVVYWYKLRNTPFYEVSSPDAAFQTITSNIPSDVVAILNRYTRTTISTGGY